MPADTGRPRLRELRDELGWTQQQLADKLAYVAWTHGQEAYAKPQLFLAGS
jgi:transcriptional regulator with XRE-family HTH domain